MTIIAIAGAAGVGKDTAALYIANRLGALGGMRVAIADPMKWALVGMMASVDPDIVDKCYGPSDRRGEVVADIIPVTVRHLLESLSVWMDTAIFEGSCAAISLHRAEQYEAEGRRCVVTDVRRGIELRRLYDEGHEVLWLTRPGHDPRPFERDLRPSRWWQRATPIENYHTAKVANDGTMTDLHAQLDHFMATRLGL